MGRDNYNRGGRSSGGKGGRHNNNNSGRGNNRSRSSTTTSTTREVKFAPQVQGKATTAPYATVKEAILLYIQKNYKHGHIVAKSLKDMKKVDLSTEEPQRVINVK